MKTITIILFCILSIVNIDSHSQSNDTDFRKKFAFGVKLGVNRSNVYDSEGEEFRTDPKYGMMGGVFFAIPIGTYIGIQPEVLISQKGFKATGKLLGTTYDLTRTSNFIAVPLLLSLKPSEFITIVVGPQYSYLFSQKDEFKTGNITVEQMQEFENDSFRKNTISAIGGFDITMKHMVLSGRAGWDIQKNVGSSASMTPRYKNAWLQASVGYRFYSY